MSVEGTLASTDSPDIQLRINHETGEKYLRIRTGVSDLTVYADLAGKMMLEVCMQDGGLEALAEVLEEYIK